MLSAVLFPTSTSRAETVATSRTRPRGGIVENVTQWSKHLEASDVGHLFQDAAVPSSWLMYFVQRLRDLDYAVACFSLDAALWFQSTRARLPLSICSLAPSIAASDPHIGTVMTPGHYIRSLVQHHNHNLITVKHGSPCSKHIRWRYTHAMSKSHQWQLIQPFGRKEP